ncbi:MAG: Sec-independent protein translocase subunit TatB [Actinobacteria bacterium]|nr:Sec-independent protein translocase subunit TatB [Actinomycetota bacterium]
MIDFNFWEILLLAAFAVILFGPEKLPELARKAARVVNYLRNIANDASGRLREELGPEFADLDLTDPRGMVTKHLLNPVQAELEPLKAELEPLKAELEPMKAMATSASAAPFLMDALPEVAPPRPVAFDMEAT